MRHRCSRKARREGKKDALLKLNKLWFMISVMQKPSMELQNSSIKMDFAVKHGMLWKFWNNKSKVGL